MGQPDTSLAGDRNGHPSLCIGDHSELRRHVESSGLFLKHRLGFAREPELGGHIDAEEQFRYSGYVG